MTPRADWWELARESLVTPRRAARVVLELHLPLRRLWELLALAAILTELMVYAELSAGAGVVMTLHLLAHPVALAAMQFAALAITAGGMHVMGQAFGGKGDFAGALALTVWLQAILLAVGLVELVLTLAVPALGGMLMLPSMLLLAWLVTNFAAELHGFRNLWLVLLGVIAGGLIFAFLLSLLQAAFGLLPPQLT